MRLTSGAMTIMWHRSTAVSRHASVICMQEPVRSCALRSERHANAEVSSLVHRYFLKPKSSLEADLQETEASCARQQAELAKNKELVVRDLKAVEGEIKELVLSNPELAQRFLAG